MDNWQLIVILIAWVTSLYLLNKWSKEASREVFRGTE